MTKKWTQKNIDAFRKDHLKIEKKYGFAFKLKLVTRYYLLSKIIEYLFKWQVVDFRINIVEKAKSKSPGRYLIE